MKLFADDEPHGVFFLIDNKSFYASCEAVARGLNPLKVPLVVLSEAQNKRPSILLFALFLDYRLHLAHNKRQECQWSGQKLSGSAECVWLSLKFTHYQIFYQRLILFNVQEGLQTSPGIWCFPQGCAPIERLLMQLLTFFCKHRDRWSRDHDCRRCCNEQWIQ